jgi:hypothetical protein
MWLGNPYTPAREFKFSHASYHVLTSTLIHLYLNDIYVSQDNMLKDAVRKYGPNAWRKVADAFENDRSELQCQLRWQKVLNPSVIKGPWTKEVRVAPSAWSLFDRVVACFAQ